jgi:hypothetical protein
MSEKKPKIIVQEPIKKSGSSIYILIPKSVKNALNLKNLEYYKLVFDPETKKIEIEFLKNKKE